MSYCILMWRWIINLMIVIRAMYKKARSKNKLSQLNNPISSKTAKINIKKGSFLQYIPINCIKDLPRVKYILSNKTVQNSSNFSLLKKKHVGKIVLKVMNLLHGSNYSPKHSKGSEKFMQVGNCLDLWGAQGWVILVMLSPKFTLWSTNLSSRTVTSKTYYIVSHHLIHQGRMVTLS